MSAALLLCGFPQAFAAGDAARGAQLFRQCAACHSTAPGEHMTGPSLSHLLNRKAASAEGFMRYSDALKRSGITWNEASLEKWLENPAAMVPGTSMTFAGIREAKARADVVAYLEASSADKAPPAANGGGRMAMGRPKADLKNPPPAGQLRSLKYCGDTYTVETADGKVEKIWEFNLRFKSDSSARGPLPGKPVVVGAGMQGDRASIVFASPAEISASIRPSCP